MLNSGGDGDGVDCLPAVIGERVWVGGGGRGGGGAHTRTERERQRGKEKERQ